MRWVQEEIGALTRESWDVEGLDFADSDEVRWAGGGVCVGFGKQREADAVSLAPQLSLIVAALVDLDEVAGARGSSLIMEAVHSPNPSTR